MPEFSNFGEAARLYAEAFDTVDAMRQLFERDVEAFLTAVKSELERTIAPKTLQELITAGYRYWWIAPTNENKDLFPQLWFRTREASIISEGQLNMIVYAPRASDGEKQQLKALAKREEFKGRIAYKSWGVFTVRIDFDRSEPVVDAVRQVVELLTMLDNVHTEFLMSQAPSSTASPI